MIRAIIIDDESRSLKLLINLLSDYCKEVEIIGTANNVKEGYDLIQNKMPDVLFLDIEMQRETGFDLLLKFNEIPFDIIFTTAFQQYALQAIKFSALDYLLKPIDVEELKLALAKVAKNKYRNELSQKFDTLINNLKHPKSEQIQLALPSSDGLTIVQIQDIIYLRSDRQYTLFQLKSGEKIVTSKNLGEYEDLLLEHNFFRVHHSALINLNEIKKYVRGDGGLVLMSNGESIEVSKRKKEHFLKQFTKK